MVTICIHEINFLISIVPVNIRQLQLGDVEVIFIMYLKVLICVYVYLSISLCVIMHKLGISNITYIAGF